ncbi:MAG TPA: FAD-dependent oxidoreductase, partial [Pirellulales bacterium]|nr:FAD-dependent oxidoreductase [Pirellulales bacterium]
KLRSNDVLGVYIEGVFGDPESPPPVSHPVGYPVTIRQDGTIALPLLASPIRVSGLTVAQAESEIHNEYIRAGILLEGKTIVTVALETGLHIGGLTSGGLGSTDIGNKAAIGGLSRVFYKRIKRHYDLSGSWQYELPEDYAGKRKGRVDADAMWMFEPHVADIVLRDMLAEAKVPVVFNQRLDLKSGVTKDGLRIESIRMETGEVYTAKMFIDATYEGDLMAGAGCSYAIGREANSQYKETLNGVQLGSKKHQFQVPIDPYVKPGDPSSGLLPGVHGGSPGEQGQGDKRIQAYNFRMCLTDVAENQVPFYKPDGYDPMRYEVSLRLILAGQGGGIGGSPMPNRKTDTNNAGAFSTDNIGMNYDYPDGDYATRERIWKEHITYQLGWMWFLCNDPRLPEKVRAANRKWGLAKDEFTDTGHWPNQLYVREARRMISDYVMTEHNCRGTAVAPDSVGMGAYGMDSHNTQRWVKGGHCSNEGDVQVHGFSPYPIAYRSIVPKESECANLLVPICMSSTHIAYGSIRMEPVFMVLGQSAATAASMAIDQNVAVQKINTSALTERLLADDQVLEWTGPNYVLVDSATLPGIVLDDDKAELAGDWVSSSSGRTHVGPSYLHNQYDKKAPELKTARFEIAVPAAGRYDVRISWAPQANRASNVPVTIASAERTKTVFVDQRKEPADKLFQSLGTFQFDTELPAVITISTEDTNGYVIVDAVQLLPVK